MKRLLLIAAAGFAARYWLKRRAERERLPLLSAQTSIGASLEEFATDADIADDNSVLGVLMLLDEYQVATAEIALNRPIEENTQELAAMLREDHKASLQRTRELIDELGLELAQVPAVSDIEGISFKRRQALNAVDDDTFEAAYLHRLIGEHEDILALIDQTLLPAAANDQVVQQVRNARERVQSHLAEARMLA